MGSGKVFSLITNFVFIEWNCKISGVQLDTRGGTREVKTIRNIGKIIYIIIPEISFIMVYA